MCVLVIGLIMSNEVSKQRIRSMKKHVNVGKQEVVAVLKVDDEAGFIDLSKKRVEEKERAKAVEWYKKSRTVHSILKRVSSQLKVPLRMLCEAIAWPLYNQCAHMDEEGELEIRSHPLDIFRSAAQSHSSNDSNDPSGAVRCALFAKLRLPEAVEKTLLENIAHLLSPKALPVRAEFAVTCFAPNGINVIRQVLLDVMKELGVAADHKKSDKAKAKAKKPAEPEAAEADELEMAEDEDEEEPLTVCLVAVPNFSVSMCSRDTALAFRSVTEVCDAVNKGITARHGQFRLVHKPHSSK